MTMLRFFPIAAIVILSACSTPRAGPEPSLAPRAAEAIDPRVPVPDTVPVGPVDAALASRLSALTQEARSSAAGFEARRATAARLAAAAGPAQSESWIVAEQALAELTRQHGQTTRIAADIDALAAVRGGTLTAADQEALRAAIAAVAAINDAEASAIAQIGARLER